MKVEYWDGCTTSGLWVDDNQFIDLSLEEKREVIKKIVDKYEISNLYDFICNFVYYQGDYSDLGGVDSWDCEYNINTSEHRFKLTDIDSVETLWIDGIENPKVTKEMFTSLIPILDAQTCQEWVINLCRDIGEYCDWGVCEQCGDIISSWTIEV